jgi:signal transduction histidine kinase
MARFDGARRNQAVDLAVALGALAFTLFLLVVPEDEGRDLDWLGVLLAVLATLPLYLRRRAPLAVFVFTTLASALLLLFEFPSGPPVGPTIALYFVALTRAEIRGSPLLTIGLVVLMYCIHVGGFAVAQGSFPGAEVVLGIPLWAAVWFAGDRTRLRRDRMAELEERAERAERDAERERRLAAAEERTRIARDLHDSAGHAINVILVHAGAARVLGEKDRDRSREAIETIESVARETLTEIDRLVRILRENEDGAVEPPTGLAALDVLAQRHRAAGLDVSILVDGPLRTLAPAVDQAAFRIVQESLTNALLHGGGTAQVALGYGTDALEIAVTNPVSDQSRTAGGGHGIVGMHERAVLVGGSLDTGRDNGVFRVRARLPYARTDER